MKDNSYDIPAMKFYIVIPPYSGGLDLTIIDGNLGIPFENVDGLNVQEVLELFHISSFALISATSYRDQCFQEHVKSILQLNFGHKYLEDRLDMRIDKVYEEALRANKDINKNAKRTYACFLERYQGKEYQEIKQLLKSNKK